LTRQLALNHATSAFTQNKRYWQDLVRSGVVVNPKLACVYQTDGFCVL